MKRPWQIWAMYALTLMVVVPAMVWLTLESLKLEQAREQDRVQTELARREAELQERVSSALWRMDGFLTNLIAREATRPWYLYQPFYDVAAFETEANVIGPKQLLRRQSSRQQSLTNAQQSGLTTDKSEDVPGDTGKDDPLEVRYRLASELLFQPSQYVRLHFEIDQSNDVSSPQTPRGQDRRQAYTHGLTAETIRQNRSLIRDVKIMCSYESMIAVCSPELLPAAPLGYDPSLPGNQVLPPIGSSEFSFFKQLQRSLQPEINRFKKSIGRTANDRLLGNSPAIPRGKPVAASKPQSTKQVAQQDRNLSRGLTEFSQRQSNAANYAMSEWTANNSIELQMAGETAATRSVREGIMQPMWIEDPREGRPNQLILVRRVVMDSQQVIQGCWLDWPRIQLALRELVSDLLPDPEVYFQPCFQQDEMRWGEVLATLPVQLMIDRPKMIQMLGLSENSVDQQLGSDLAGTRIIRRALWIAWAGLIFAAVAGAFLLNGVLRLNERRGAFVSAVSHELRTPLTTFRMYAEMLAEKMVPAEKQQQYAETLKVESERLWHLVENVLQFARLERSNQKRRLEEVTISQALDRFQDRLQRRADRAGMILEMDLPKHVLDHPIKTDVGAIEQILFNLIDNACKYARDSADRRIRVTGQLTKRERVSLSVRDFGPGVTKRNRERMFQPFRKSDIEAANTAQGVGLGLALCRRMAASLGGKLVFEDVPAEELGTMMTLEIPSRS